MFSFYQIPCLYFLLYIYDYDNRRKDETIESQQIYIDHLEGNQQVI